MFSIRALASALVYDATQNLLPRRKDPEQPHWSFPREYGIDEVRRKYVARHVKIITEKFINFYH